MENINIGIANKVVLNKLNESYFDNKLLEESSKVYNNYLTVIKDSPILQLENKVYNNIESKHIENDLLIKEYIDNHIILFETYTLEEIQAERLKLKPFISEGFDDDNIKLYEAIDKLITESLKVGNDVDSNGAHDAFTMIFNHIKTPKKSSLTEGIEAEILSEEVIEIAVRKFNEKYSNIDESDNKLLNLLIKYNLKEKKALFETYKTDILTILENVNDDESQDSISKAIKKIKEMVSNGKTIDDNIAGLHYFKKELL